MHQIPSSAAPRAVLSRSALRASASTALAGGGRIADLRRDAHGHGLLPVARAVIDAGAERVLVDGPAEIAQLAQHALPATDVGTVDIDSHLLYGIPGQGASVPLPPLRLLGRVMSTKQLRAGDGVSYGYTYRAVSPHRIALVTGGYAQGIVRALGNRAAVEIGGVMRPIIGRVAMDVCVVDLGESRAEVGQPATFFGGSGPARSALAEWADVTGLTAAELMTVAASHAIHEEED
ncbi:alanine racemase C-terminal domain-containing protein [uncultured Microbacterium sp.]|uniref:alanine racemase C-terminal domain-containing protein n=1 Tax=uncultured Microbacterium sp. TaxID=191216 RepID=UPI00262FEA59|nr:alanine racemase C-terminal domain-containing protein [uncultured Microbacterium sp.]